MKHKTMKKLMALTMAFTLCVGLTGCQSGGENSVDADVQNSVEQEQQTGTPTANENENENGDALSMGRYVEKQAELDGALEGHSCMVKDGEHIKVIAYGEKIYTSEDNGDSWSSESLDWYTKFLEDNYIMTSAISGDGTFAIQYSPLSHTADAYEEGKEEDEGTETDTLLDPHLITVSPDGTQHEIPVEYSKEDMYARTLHFTQNGSLIAVTFNKGVYEVDLETGALKRICTINENAVYIDSREKLLMIGTYGGILFYDMESERFIEDDVLADFVKDTYTELTDYGNCYNLYAFLGEDNVIYIAGEKGLHRHVIGGSAVEQVIDPSLSSFGNPSRQIVHAMELGNQEFLAQFSDGSLIKFYYDATVPTVPNEKLLVYSLKNNDTVRQAIAAYQTANPGMYVEYEVALEEGGVTREDALKNLSTNLLNGEGPDVLILDNMPMDTYVEKGILLDMNDVITEVKGSDGLFENLLEPFVQDGSIYVTPMEFQLPVVMGQSEYIEQAKDYKGYAQSIEELRAANPEGKIISDCNEIGITMRFIPSCAAAWKNEDGSMNENSIREFLELTKQVYDAQMSGVSQKQISDYNDVTERSFRTGYGDGTDGQIDWSFYFKMINADAFLAQGTKMESGNVYSMSTLTEMLSMPRNKGAENLSVSLFDGQSKSVYMPQTMTGINAQSKNIEAAKSFVRLMLSEEVQTNMFLGLPVNKKAFDMLLNEHDDTRKNDEGYMMYGGSDNEGNSWFWESWWFSEEQKQLVKDWTAQAKTPYIEDSTIEEAVQNSCVEYLKGRLDIDAAVAEIMQSTAIYMSE